MSQVKDQTVAAARRRDFGNAYVLANGLAMDELLGALAAIETPLLADMKAQSGPSTGKVDMPRIQYAMQVVLTRSIPTLAPGDLTATGQVNVARTYLRAQVGTTDATKLAAIVRALDEGRLIGEMNDVKVSSDRCPRTVNGPARVATSVISCEPHLS